MISSLFAHYFAISLGVMSQFRVCGSEISVMRNITSLLNLAAFILLGLASCRENNIVPVSANEKITALVVQAETETKKIQSSVDLTANSISIENLALSPDYFVDEHHLSPLALLDTQTTREPWKKECNTEFLRERGFGKCLLSADINPSQTTSLVQTLKEYAAQQKEILNDEYQLFVDLKSHYKDRIAADIDSFMRAEIDESSFQQKMKQYQQDFLYEFNRQRNANKNLSMLSVNYRKALETIQSTLSEAQFKQFYICHKR
jgi:hypothetical protein